MAQQTKNERKCKRMFKKYNVNNCDEKSFLEKCRKSNDSRLQDSRLSTIREEDEEELSLVVPDDPLLTSIILRNVSKEGDTLSEVPSHNENRHSVNLEPLNTSDHQSCDFDENNFDNSGNTDQKLVCHTGELNVSQPQTWCGDENDISPKLKFDSHDKSFDQRNEHYIQIAYPIISLENMYISALYVFSRINNRNKKMYKRMGAMYGGHHEPKTYDDVLLKTLSENVSSTFYNPLFRNSLCR